MFVIAMRVEYVSPRRKSVQLAQPLVRTVPTQRRDPKQEQKTGHSRREIAPLVRWDIKTRRQSRVGAAVVLKNHSFPPPSLWKLLFFSFRTGPSAADIFRGHRLVQQLPPKKCV